MPHIVLENINTIKDAYDAIKQFSEKTQTGLLKVSDKFINAKQIKDTYSSIAYCKTNLQHLLIN